MPKADKLGAQPMIVKTLQQNIKAPAAIPWVPHVTGAPCLNLSSCRWKPKNNGVVLLTKAILQKRNETLDWSASATFQI